MIYLLVEDWLCLTTETHLLAVVSSLSLLIVRKISRIVIPTIKQL